MYFCNLCAYSSCGKAHLAVHAYLAHDVQPVPWHRNTSSAERQPSPTDTKYIVKPVEYVCALCKNGHFKCLTTAVFREHLEQKHCGLSAYTCHLCFAHAHLPGILLEHYRCDHAFFNAHCLYCDSRGDDDWFIMRHVMEEHPNRPFRLLLRNGDVGYVIQEVQKLAAEYLSREPVEPVKPVPQPFLPGIPEVELCAQMTTPNSDGENRLTSSSGKAWISESVPLDATMEDTSCNKNENEEQTVEMDVESVEAEYEQPAELVPEPFMPGSPQVEGGSQSIQRTSNIDSANSRRSKESSDVPCITESKVLENLSERACCHENEQQTVEGAVENMEAGPGQPAVHLSQLLAHASSQIGACSNDTAVLTPETVINATLQGKDAENNTTCCNTYENQHIVERNVGQAEIGECLLTDAQRKTEPHNDHPTPMNENFPILRWQEFFCNIEDCTKEFHDVFDFMNHLAEHHPLLSSLHCPKCGFVVSFGDLLAHIVDEHSGVIFCPYRGCSFGSQNQCDIDSHIIRSHQIYQEEQTANDRAAAATKTELCARNISHSPSYAEERCNNMADTDPVVCSENGMADDQCNVGEAETAENVGTKYFCDTCSTIWETMLPYLHHMTTVHAVAFFCGHCLKCYKKSRSLLMHAGRHLGLPFSVWQLEDGKVVDIGKLVAPSWIDEARRYLQFGSHSKLKARGRTMLRNLKIAVEYVASACLNNDVAQQHSDVPSHTDDSQTPEIPQLKTQLMVGCLPSEVPASPPLQDNVSHEPLSALSIHNDNGVGQSLEKCNESGLLPCVLSNIDLTSIKASLSHQESVSTKTPVRMKSRRSMPGKVNLRVHASAYIDASSCKRVNGELVIEEEVLQKLSRLNTMNMHRENVTKGANSVLSGVNGGSHVCSTCLISYDSFEELCKHFAETHNDSASSETDSASASSSLQGDWKLPQFTSHSNTFRNVRPLPAGHVQVGQPKNNLKLHFKQAKLKRSNAPAITSSLDKLFVNLTGARVPYAEFASKTDLNSVVRLVKLPQIKQEPV